jgi:hypothetical protein
MSFFAGAKAQAQVGVYLNPVVSHVGISTADSGPFAFLGDGETSRWFGGLDFGGYWDFYHLNKVNLGVDMRETVQHGNNAALNTFSVAPRVSSKPLKGSIQPYAELQLGAGRSRAEHSAISTTRFQIGIFAGVDYPIAKYVDFRVVELGYSNVQTMSSSVERASTNIPNANLFSISSGLVFTFGKK